MEQKKTKLKLNDGKITAISRRKDPSDQAKPPQNYDPDTPDFLKTPVNPKGSSVIREKVEKKHEHKQVTKAKATKPKKPKSRKKNSLTSTIVVFCLALGLLGVAYSALSKQFELDKLQDLWAQGSPKEMAEFRSELLNSEDKGYLLEEAVTELAYTEFSDNMVSTGLITDVVRYKWLDKIVSSEQDSKVFLYYASYPLEKFEPSNYQPKLEGVFTGLLMSLYANGFVTRSPTDIAAQVNVLKSKPPQSSIAVVEKRFPGIINDASFMADACRLVLSLNKATPDFHVDIIDRHADAGTVLISDLYSRSTNISEKAAEAILANILDHPNFKPNTPLFNWANQSNLRGFDNMSPIQRLALLGGRLPNPLPRLPDKNYLSLIEHPVNNVRQQAVSVLGDNVKFSNNASWQVLKVLSDLSPVPAPNVMRNIAQFLLLRPENADFQTTSRLITPLTPQEVLVAILMNSKGIFNNGALLNPVYFNLRDKGWKPNLKQALELIDSESPLIRVVAYVGIAEQAKPDQVKSLLKTAAKNEPDPALRDKIANLLAE